MDMEADTGAVVVGETTSIRWGAVIAGAVVAVATWGLLLALGMAIGLSSVDTSNASSARTSGLFTGIWGVVSPLVALFIGGVVAGRGAGLVHRGGGAIHGFVMWSLATVAGAWLVVNLVGTVVGGAVSVGKAAVQAGGSAIAAGAQKGGGLAQQFGLDADDALAPINQRLQAQGKPTVTADQLRAATGDIVRDAVRTGDIDRDRMIGSIQANTALSRADAEQVANQVSAQYQQFKSRTGEKASAAAEKVQTGALQAAEATGKVFWGVFAALLLGLISAVAGGIVGVSRSQRTTAARAERVVQRPLSPREA